MTDHASRAQPHDPELALPEPTPVSRDSTAGVAVMAHLRRQTAALFEADSGVRQGVSGSVHAARVAARRLRSGLRVYGDLLTDDLSAGLRQELSWYAGELSPARDAEVLVARLRSDETDPRLAAAMLPWLERRMAALETQAQESLDGAHADALRHRLAALAREPRFTGKAAKRAGKVLAPRVLRADHRAEKQLDPLRAGEAHDAWHAARIAAKRARYAAEVGAPALGGACRDLAKLWAHITEPLGEAQDAVIQRALVEERVLDATAPIDAQEAFVCGVFVAATRERETEAHHRARQFWHDSRAEHKRLRRALSG